MIETAPKFDFSLLRQLRKRQGLTMEEVSSRSGVSLAVISKLERNQSAGGIDTLYRIGRVFGMSAADLLALAESPFAHRESEKSHESGGFSFRDVRYANVRALAGEAKKGATISRPEIHRDDHELCWVLEGRLRLKLPHETCELRAGESLQFDAIMEHTYEALADCRLMILHLRKENRY